MLITGLETENSESDNFVTRSVVCISHTEIKKHCMVGVWIWVIDCSWSQVEGQAWYLNFQRTRLQKVTQSSVRPLTSFF